MAISMTSRRLWNYFIDEVNDDANENKDPNLRINNSETTTIKPVEYKTKITESKLDNDNTLDKGNIFPLNIRVVFGDLFISPWSTVK